MLFTTRVGIDVVEIARFGRLVRSVEVEQAGLFTGAELEAARAGGHFVSSLAARYAAKEAVFKLLEDLDPFACDWTEIEVVSRASGGLGVRLSGTAASLAEARGFADIAISLSHSRTIAVAAAVVAEPC